MSIEVSETDTIVEKLNSRLSLQNGAVGVERRRRASRKKNMRSDRNTATIWSIHLSLKGSKLFKVFRSWFTRVRDLKLVAVRSRSDAHGHIVSLARSSSSSPKRASSYSPHRIGLGVFPTLCTGCRTTRRSIWLWRVWRV